MNSIVLMLRIPVAVVLGFLIDLIVGDPRWMYHPVQAIGKCIEWYEKGLRKLFGNGKGRERAAGICCALLVIVTTLAVTGGLLYLCYHLNFWLGFALDTFWCYQLLAVRSLRTESMKVYKQLIKKDLPAARYAVSMIVGRDTENLTEEGVAKAAVETVAESTSDGIVAPLFFMLIGGAFGAYFYKAINTMDSMIGYKNDRYMYFGTAAAIMDDIVNFIPARFAGLCMIPAAWLTGFDAKNAWRMFLRDRKKHASPNSAHTEAAMAGALQVQLAGDAWYFGKLKKKQTLGDPIRPVEAEDIPRANRLMTATAVVSMVILVLIRLLAAYLCR
ncbi:MAG: adenosylcobinamide-phosphate synthase CbiB [Eubacteriales bacterium]|nr:adenosylcobinamide-phosphate synthase CbiB [Eubacteriales bacterium]